MNDRIPDNNALFQKMNPFVLAKTLFICVKSLFVIACAVFWELPVSWQGFKALDNK